MEGILSVPARAGRAQRRSRQAPRAVPLRPISPLATRRPLLVLDSFLLPEQDEGVRTANDRPSVGSSFGGGILESEGNIRAILPGLAGLDEGRALRLRGADGIRAEECARVIKMASDEPRPIPDLISRCHRPSVRRRLASTSSRRSSGRSRASGRYPGNGGRACSPPSVERRRHTIFFLLPGAQVDPFHRLSTRSPATRSFSSSLSAISPKLFPCCEGTA